MSLHPSITADGPGRCLIRAEHVGVYYRLRRKLAGSKQFWALRDVSLEVRQGEALGVLGSNGAGKSTLMRALAGIIGVDRGCIWRDPRFSVALLSLGVGFEGNLSGRQNAILSGLLLGMRRATIEQRLDAVCDLAGLGEFFEQPVFTYSSGMVLRLGFAVAMQANPDVLLIDEVFAVGDVNFREKSTRAVQARLEAGRTVVLITHDLISLRRLCTRAVWIDGGTTRLSGSVEEVARAVEGLPTDAPVEPLSQGLVGATLG